MIDDKDFKKAKESFPELYKQYIQDKERKNLQDKVKVAIAQRNEQEVWTTAKVVWYYQL